MTTVHCHAFVAKLLETIDFLDQRFPSERDLKLARAKVKSSAAINPRLVVSQFISEVLPYTDELGRRDSAFFLELLDKDYSVLGHLQISKKWDALSDQEREYLWGNLDKMLKLGSLVISPS